jgi:hypothetical protein
MEVKPETFAGVVDRFDREGGWYFVPAPVAMTRRLGHLADRGLIAVEARVGPVTWQTSLLPMGDGTHFLALPARVRRAQRLDVGDIVRVEVVPRDRSG